MENEDDYANSAQTERLDPFDVREQSGRRGLFLLLGSAFFLLLLALLVRGLFSSGTRDRNMPPRINADNTPYKEIPLERGGAQTPNQDKEIYQVINGGDTDTIVTTVPSAEAPLPKPMPISQPSGPKPMANVVIKEPNAQPATQPSGVRPGRPARPAPTTPVVMGDYVVQVASLRSYQEAETMWHGLMTKMDDIVGSSYRPDIKRVDLADKGIYYRLRIGGLADNAAAKRLCTRLKARGQDCIVTRR